MTDDDGALFGARGHRRALILALRQQVEDGAAHDCLDWVETDGRCALCDRQIAAEVATLIESYTRLLWQYYKEEIDDDQQPD